MKIACAFVMALSILPGATSLLACEEPEPPVVEQPEEPPVIDAPEEPEPIEPIEPEQSKP